MLTLCVVVSVLVIVVFLQLLIKFIKSRLKRKDQRDIEVSHETGTRCVSTNGMKITNNVTVNNGHAPKMEDETHRGSSESVALLGNGRVNMEQTDTAHDLVEETPSFSSSPSITHGLPESDTKATGHDKSTDAQTTME
ncbi:uncharacterized protein [Ptychodera flava]|uniref:uncharacterized protein n=1 Tax=Ptychodera flava TaxID=63121 RepID=UPI00396A95A7